MNEFKLEPTGNPELDADLQNVVDQCNYERQQLIEMIAKEYARLRELEVRRFNDLNKEFAEEVSNVRMFHAERELDRKAQVDE